MNAEHVAPHFRVDNYAHTLSWTNGELDYIEYTDENGDVYRMTLSWTNGEITSLTAWTKQ